MPLRVVNHGAEFCPSRRPSSENSGGSTEEQREKFDPDTANERLWIRIRRVFEEAGVLAINCWAFLQRANTEVELQNRQLFESTRLYCFQEFRCIRQRRSKYAKGAGTG
jgi:hypothetical protein